jgi:hypothetical protein
LLLTIVVEDQFIVLEPEQVQQRGLVIVGRYLVDGRAVAHLIRFSVNHGGLDATAGEPGAEALTIVISSTTYRITLGDWQSSNFTAPVNNCRFE